VEPVSVYGKYTVVISDDPRYEKGKVYDLVLDTSVTPDPTDVVVATTTDMSVPTATTSVA
jgi:hypothetical protein